MHFLFFLNILSKKIKLLLSDEATLIISVFFKIKSKLSKSKAEAKNFILSFFEYFFKLIN